VLYRKPKRRSTFRRCGVILCHGQLLIFHSALRNFSGKMLPQIHHERECAIDLKDCYIYSGLVTESDLLYQNQTFDSNNPSRHALPRIYREDGWTSSDEDTMTCFVVWQPRQKSFFRTTEQVGGGHRKSLKRVSQLGAPGRSIVFKTRSRVERDHWVMNISTEIERLQQVEEVRVISK
jgi:Pleckstrin homology domain